VAWRIRIPTVLYATSGEPHPEPHVSVDEIGDPEHAQQLSIAETEAAIAWLSASKGWLEGARVRQVADALGAALRALASSPPRIITDTRMGMVQGERSSGEPQWLCVSVEGAVNEPSNPRIVIEVAGDPHAMACGDTWWLLHDEAKRLAALLRDLSGGTLCETGPNQRPWLHVTHHPETVSLRFDDDLIAEQGSDGVFVLNPIDAGRLAVLLDEAASFERAHPAHVFAPPEPREREIARVELVTAAETA
jgi:hypothetical protein